MQLNSLSVAGRSAGAAVLSVLFYAVSCAGAAPAVRVVQRPLTIAASIETTRPMVGEQLNPLLVSPDGTRYVVMLIRGDAERDGVVATLMVGGLVSLDAVRPRVVAEFFTRGLGASSIPTNHNSASLTLPRSNFPAWLDNRRLLLTWEDERAVKQLVSVDVETRQIRYLTQHPTPVISFTASKQGGTMYAALLGDSQDTSGQLLRQGFAVTSLDALALLDGKVGHSSHHDQMEMYEQFVSTPSHTKARKIVMKGSGENLSASKASLLAGFSPDGRLAILAGTPSRVPDDWYRYKSQSFGWNEMLKEYRVDPHSFRARDLTQLFVVDVEKATGRPLWDAPLDATVWPQPKLAWSQTSRSLILGPTLLPAARADAAGLVGNVVAEVEVATGRYWELPLPSEASRNISSIRWLSASVVEISHGGQTTASWFRKVGGKWKSFDVNQNLAARNSGAAPVRVELRQGLNTPPAFFAVEIATGREQMILDLNPRLRSDYMLGRVEMVRWTAPDGRPWTGRLYYPVDYVPGHAYPLVIQTYGFAPATEFSIYGLGQGRHNLGPGAGTRLAQQLANRRIAVLQLGGPDGVGIHVASFDDFTMQAAGREAGAEYLATRGLVDPTKVGLEGFSYLGRQVEHAITFSDFPYAAAIANDYSDNNYLQSILQMTSLQDMPGVVPFDRAGLQMYLKHSPAFNAQRIRTPLQVVVNGHADHMMLTNWEIFAWLRYLNKPVEMYVAPDMERGNHILQNPRQILSVQQRGLDWWCYWLRNEEDQDPAKAGQYAQWQRLRALHDADVRKLRTRIDVPIDAGTISSE